MHLHSIYERYYRHDYLGPDPRVVSYRIVGKVPRTFNAVNYTIILAHMTQGLAGAKIWPAEQWPVINDGSSFHQIYAGPSEFVIRV